MNDLLNPPLQQVHPRVPLRCSIWVDLPVRLYLQLCSQRIL